MDGYWIVMIYDCDGGVPFRSSRDALVHHILFYCRCCGHWTIHRQHRDIHSWHGACQCQPYPRIPQYYATMPTCIISLPQSLLYVPLFKLLPPICIFKFLPSSDFDWASGHAYVSCLVTGFLFCFGRGGYWFVGQI
jgi:hypothetical protein